MAKTLTERKRIGNLGEDIAERFLVKRGFSIMGRNYTKKWGEIDIVAKNKGILYFIEVKTVSCENISTITREARTHRPEENLHQWKIDRLGRALQSYILENRWKGEWQLDALLVYMDEERLEVKVETISNIIIEDRFA